MRIFRGVAVGMAMFLSVNALADRVAPGAARTSGRNNAFFQTDLRLLNTSSTDATTVTVVYYPSDGPPVEAPELRVEPRQQLAFNNVVETLFGIKTDTTGSLRVMAPDLLDASTRTYNINDPCTGGTFGSWIPGLLVSEAITDGVILHAAGSADSTTGFRTNVIVANPSLTTSANLIVKLRRGDSTLLGMNGPIAVGPGRVFQADVFALTGSSVVTTDNAYIEFSSDQPVLAISSVIDNRTNDAAVIRATRIEPEIVPPAPTLVSVGDIATFSGSYGVSGTATIVSPNTIQVTGFNANGTAPGMDLRVGKSSVSRRDFPVLRVLGRQSFAGSTLEVILPSNVDLNAFDTFTVWCFEFNVLIAEGKFRKP